MRIGLDLFALVPKAGRGAGVHRYATGLVQGLYELDDDHEYVLFVNRLNAPMFPVGGRFEHHVVSLPPQRQVWPFRILWQQLLLPIQARRHRLDVVHFPFETAAALMGRAYVVTIHDVIPDVYYPKHHPRSIPKVKSKYLFQAKHRAASRAAAIICPSQASANELVRHHGLSREAIVVIPEAPAKHFFGKDGDPPRGSSDERPYILSVVSLSPHKNIEGVVRAFVRARADYDLPHELRIVGMLGNGSRPVEQYLAEACAHDHGVRYLGFVDEDELISLYRGADMLLHLPYVEGFGFPPIEAMAMGVPVVASDVASVPEVCGDAALLVPPDDVDAAARAVGRIAGNGQVSARMREAGRRRAREFSWRKTAEATRAVYERVLGS